MSQDHIRYDILAQDALRGVIKKVLIETAATNQLPGEHHFFITFLTDAPGVRISSALQERYPEQMTIVIQHQFWDLKVSETQFEIGLSFSDKPEKLVIPFSAIRGFYDPSVNFELEFDHLVAQDELDDADMQGEVTQLSSAPVALETPMTESATDAVAAKSDKGEEGVADDGSETKADKNSDNGADVVSLDAFRKKPS